MAGKEADPNTNSDVHFETGATQVEELCALVEESLLKLSVVDLYEVATGLGIREGRLKDRQGKTKSRLVMLREISQLVEKKSSESVETGLELLTPLCNDLKERLRGPDNPSTAAAEKAVKSKEKKDKKDDSKPEELMNDEVDADKDDSVTPKADGEKESTTSSAVESPVVGSGDDDDRKENSSTEKEDTVTGGKGSEEERPGDKHNKTRDSEEETEDPSSEEQDSEKKNDSSEASGKTGDSEEEERKIELEMKELQERLGKVKMEKASKNTRSEKQVVDSENVLKSSRRRSPERKAGKAEELKEIMREGLSSDERSASRKKVSYIDQDREGSKSHERQKDMLVKSKKEKIRERKHHHKTKRERSPDEKKSRKKDEYHRKERDSTENDEKKPRKKDEYQRKERDSTQNDEKKFRKRDRYYRKEEDSTDKDEKESRKKDRYHRKEDNSTENDDRKVRKRSEYKRKERKQISSESEETSQEERNSVDTKTKVYQKKKYSSDSDSSSSDEERTHVEKRKGTMKKPKKRYETETVSRKEKKTVNHRAQKKNRKKLSESEITSSEEEKRKLKENVKKTRKERDRYSEPESSDVEQKVLKKRKAKKKTKKKIKYQSESSGAESSQPLKRSDLLSLRKAWRPPLKFTGQYGKTDDWSEFTSLKRAIDKAVEKKPPYEEDDIVEAALRSISAGTDLRKFLDGTPDLTLDLLIETLRSFYMEPDEKDLMRDLTKLCQAKEEDAQHFVMRGIDIVHQFGTKKKSRVSESMAYEMLLESLETGFNNDNIRHRMRPYLQDSTTSEKELLSAIKSAKKSEIDRKSKFDPRAARVHEVSVEDDRLMAAVLSKVEGIGADVTEVKQYVGYTNKADEQNKENTDPAEKRVIYGCKDCKAKGINRNCRHCFICGKDAHRAESCPDKNKNLSNLKRPPMGTN